jgi:hypothetical protein
MLCEHVATPIAPPRGGRWRPRGVSRPTDDPLQPSLVARRLPAASETGGQWQSVGKIVGKVPGRWWLPILPSPRAGTTAPYPPPRGRGGLQGHGSAHRSRALAYVNGQSSWAPTTFKRIQPMLWGEKGASVERASRSTPTSGTGTCTGYSATPTCVANRCHSRRGRTAAVQMSRDLTK